MPKGAESAYGPKGGAAGAKPNLKVKKDPRPKPKSKPTKKSKVSY